MKVLNLFNPSSPGLERLNRFVYDDDGGIIYYVEIDNSGNAGIGSIANPTFNSYNGNNVIPGFSIVRYTYFDQGINSVTISASEMPYVKEDHFICMPTLDQMQSV
ncbi:MAG: hypothetical protein IPG39_06215 [Bacteroidetes bacterium]|nr:hypothetical protein [Bacteroidota bacterium]